MNYVHKASLFNFTIGAAVSKLGKLVLVLLYLRSSEKEGRRRVFFSEELFQQIAGHEPTLWSIGRRSSLFRHYSAYSSMPHLPTKKNRQLPYKKSHITISFPFDSWVLPSAAKQVVESKSRARVWQPADSAHNQSTKYKILFLPGNNLHRFSNIYFTVTELIVKHTKMNVALCFLRCM